MTSLRERFRLIELASSRAGLSAGDVVVLGAIVGLASKVFFSRGYESDSEFDLKERADSTPDTNVQGSSESSLFRFGSHAREVQGFLFALNKSVQDDADVLEVDSRLAAEQLTTFINNLVRVDAARAALTQDPARFALNGIAEARGDKGPTPPLSADALNARAELIEVLQSVLRDLESYTVEPVDPLASLTRLSGEQVTLSEEPSTLDSSTDSRETDSLAPGELQEISPMAEEKSASTSESDQASEDLDSFDLDSDQGYEIASGIGDLSIAAVDPSAVGLGGFLPAGALGGGGGAAGVDGVFIADAPAAPAVPSTPALSTPDAGFSAPAAAQPFTGRVIDGYVEGATVFVDLDGNFVLDWTDTNSNNIWDSGEGEVWAITDSRGEFSFASATADQLAGRIVSLGGVDVTTLAAVDLLTAPEGKAYVTPLSTVFAYAERARQEDSELPSGADLLGAMGLTAADLSYDPAAQAATNDQAANVLKVGASLLTVANNAAALTSELGGLSSVDAYDKVFNSIARLQSSDVAKLLSTNATNSTVAIKSVLNSSLESAGVVVSNYADLVNNTAASVAVVTNALQSLSAEAIRAGEQLALASTGQTTLLADIKAYASAVNSGDTASVTAKLQALQSAYTASNIATLKAKASAKLAFNSQDGSQVIASKADSITVAAPVSGDVVDSFDLLANDSSTDGSALELAAVGLFDIYARKANLELTESQVDQLFKLDPETSDPEDLRREITLDAAASGENDVYNGMQFTLLSSRGTLVATVDDYLVTTAGDQTTKVLKLTVEEVNKVERSTDPSSAESESQENLSYLLAPKLPESVELAIVNNKLQVTSKPSDTPVNQLDLIYVVQVAGDPSEAETNLVTLNILPTPVRVSASDIVLTESIDDSRTVASIALSTPTDEGTSGPSFEKASLGTNGSLQFRGLPLDSLLSVDIAGATKTFSKDVGSPFWTIRGTDALSADYSTLKALIPGNFVGGLTIEVIATTRYGGLSSRFSDSFNVEVTPAADGVVPGKEASLGSLLTLAIAPSTEDQASPLFTGEQALKTFIDSLTLALRDSDSESPALRLEVADGWQLSLNPSSSVLARVNSNQSIELFDTEDTPLATALAAIKVQAPPEYYGSASDAVSVYLGSYERSLPLGANGLPSQNDVRFSDVPLQLSLTVAPTAEAIAFDQNALLLLQLNEDQAFSLPVGTFLDKSLLVDGDEIIYFELTLPDTLSLQELVSGQAQPLVPASVSEQRNTYVLEFTHAELTTDSINDRFLLIPRADYSTPDGTALEMELKATTVEPSNGDAFETDIVRIPISINAVADEPGRPSAGQALSVEETQTGVDYNAFTELSKLIYLPTRSSSLSSGDQLSLQLKDVSDKLEFAIREGASGSYTFKALERDSDGEFREVSIDEFGQIVVGGKSFESGDALLEASLISRDGSDTRQGDAITATLNLKPVASGILSAPSLVVVGEQGQTPVLEDGAGALLSQFIGTNGAAVQLDASEALFYRVYIPDSAKLVSVQSDSQAAGFVRPPLATREIVSNKSYLTYLVPEDDLAGLKVLPNSNVAGELTVKFKAVSVEADGSRAEGSIQTTSLIVTPVADMPVLVAPDAVAGTISATNSSLAIPVQAALRDATGEVLGARIEISGIQSTQDLTFTLGAGESLKTLAVTSDGQSFGVEVPAADVSQLSSLRVSSANDYRGAEKVTLTIKAIATDAFPANGVVYSDVAEASQTVSLSIYQPVGVPTFNLGPDVEAITQGAIAFKLSLPELWVNGLGDVSYDDTSVLMTGVPSTAYFAVKSGGSPVPVGATLGEGGVWLFAGSDIYQGVTPKTLYIINGGSVAITNGSMSATAYIADPTGGTTNQSLSDTLTLNFDPESETYKDASDPVILSLNGEALSSSQAGGFSFELNSSVTGVETPTYWVSGDATNLSGFAFLVRPGVGEGEVDALADLYADFAEVALFDADQNGVVTASELSVEDAFASLWFDKVDSDTGVVDGFAQQGELVSLEGFEDFAITLPPRLAREAADGEIIPLYEAGLRYTLAGTEVSTEGLAYATGIPYVSANGPATAVNVDGANTVLTSKPSAAIHIFGEHKSSGTSSDPVEVPEDLEGGVRFRVELNPADLASGVQGSLTHLVKISGVPPEAKLSAGAFVPAVVGTESKPASEAFWVVTESQAQNTLSVIGLPENYTGTLSLTATPVASLVTGSNASSVITVLSGPTSSVAVANVMGVADDPLISSLDADNEGLDADNEVSLAEGGELSNLQSLVSLARSTGDSEEDLYLRFSLDTDASNFVVTGEGVAEVGMGSGLYEVKWDDVANVNINFNSFYQTETTLSLQGVSKQGTSYALSGTTVEIKLDFYPVADGVEKGETLTQGLDTVEGSSAVISSVQTTVLDPSEMAQFELLVKLSRAFGATSESSPNDLLGISSPSVAVVERELAPSDFERWGLDSEEAETQGYRLFVIESPAEGPENTFSAKDLSLQLDKFFDGTIDYKVRAFSVDPASGVQSSNDDSEIVSGILTVYPVVQDGSFVVTVSNAQGQALKRITVDEGGQSGPFFVNLEAFDKDEVASLLFNTDTNFTVEAVPLADGTPAYVLKHTGAVVPTSASSLAVTPSITLTDDPASGSFALSAQSFAVWVNKSVSTPELDTISDSISIAILDGVTNLSLPLPPTTAVASDDLLYYSLRNVPVWLTPSVGTLISTSGGFAEYRFSEVQRTQVEWKATRAYLEAPSEKITMQWQAVHVEPTNLLTAKSDIFDTDIERWPSPAAPSVTIVQGDPASSINGFDLSKVLISVPGYSSAYADSTVSVLLDVPKEALILREGQPIGPFIEIEGQGEEPKHRYELTLEQLRNAVLKPNDLDFSGEFSIDVTAIQRTTFDGQILKEQTTLEGRAIQVVDRNPPTISLSVNESVLGVDETATVTLTFSESPKELPAVTVSAGVLGSFTQDDSDPLTYTAAFTPPVDDPGSVVSFAVASWTDAAGNSGTLSGSLPTITVDTAAPSPANILLIDPNSGTPNDYLTNDPTPKVILEAESGADLKLYQQQRDNEGGLLNSVEVDPSIYQWVESTNEQGLSSYIITVPTESALASGEYRVDVIDRAGNVSETSGASNVFKVDRESPQLLSLDPENASQTLGLRPTFSLTFNEQMRVGEGFIKLYQSNDQGTPVEIIDIQSPTVTLNDEINRFVISLTAPLLKDTEYFVLIDDGALTDSAGNAFSGISESSTWSFTAKGATLFVDNPYDDLMVNLVESGKDFVVTGRISGDKEILDLLAKSDIKLEINDTSDLLEPLTLTANSLSSTDESPLEWTILIPRDTFKANTEGLFNLRFSVSGQKLENGEFGIDEKVSKSLWVDTVSPIVSSVSVSLSEGQALSKDFHVELDFRSLWTPEGFESIKDPGLELILDNQPLFTQTLEGESITVIATTGDLSAFFINPESTLSLVVTDSAGNTNSLQIEITESFLFGPTFESNTQDARANFSNLGLLAAETTELSSQAIIDAGLGYVISDDMALNNIEIAESLGIKGSRGDDYMVARDEGSVLDGGTGNDTLLGGLAQDYLDGGEGDDVLVPLGFSDVMRTGEGNDVIEISSDAFYEQTSWEQMENLLLRVTQAGSEGVQSILNQLKTAQEASLAETGATSYENRFVGIVQDFSDTDVVEFSGFSDTQGVIEGNFSMNPGVEVSYQFVKEFANPVGSDDPDYIFTSIMLVSDANAWTMEAVDEELTQLGSGR